MIHDCGISDHYVVLPVTPLKCSMNRMKKGGNHWAWDPNEDQWYGIVPRRGGRPEDIVWLRAENGKIFTFLYFRRTLTDFNSTVAFHGHVAGCYENEDGHIVFDLTVADQNVFVFFPPKDQQPEGLEKRNKLRSQTYR